MLELFFFSCSLLMGVLFVSPAQTESIRDRLTGDPRVPWRIKADTIGYDAPNDTYHATGNVIIEKEGTRLTADSVAFDNKAKTAFAQGHILMTVGDDVLTGDRLELNLSRETGVLHDGAVLLKKNHFIIRGDRIEKTGPETYRAENGTVTTCKGQEPDWSVQGRTVEVTIEGYGTASHARFTARSLPILYTPFIVFPVKTRRQTGLLLPEVGLSDRKGFSWEQPLFWAINDHTDATATALYMEKRGTKAGLEYRYAMTRESKGTLMADGMQDRQIDDGTPESTSQWGYAGDAYDRPNHDRYWLRAKADQQLPYDAMASLDLDVVSDQDYLTEFRDGRSGYFDTRSVFRADFGRDLAPPEESIRTNRLNINRPWSRFSFNGDLLWNDNVANRRWEETDDTLQQLPSLRFGAVKQQAFGTAFFWDVNADYTYFYREEGQRGYRADLYPRAYLPFRWENYLSIEPSAGWRQTAWRMDRWEDETLERTTYRQQFDAQLDLFSEISRIMASPLASADRIRHQLRPRVVYRYIPGQDQSNLPDFTEDDRIEETNIVTYSLTNLFTARRPQPVRASVDENDKRTGWFEQNDRATRPFREMNLSAPFRYDRFCRFYLEQSYDLEAAREEGNSAFSDVFGELDVRLSRYFILDADARFDVYEGGFSTHNVGTAISDRRGDRLWIEHRYQRDASETIRGTLALRVSNRFTARGTYERNLIDQVDISKGLGFLYNAQCWSLDVFYAVEGENKKVSFFINLMGIGGFGQPG